jgi:hypothetical protein
MESSEVKPEPEAKPEPVETGSIDTSGFPGEEPIETGRLGGSPEPGEGFRSEQGELLFVNEFGGQLFRQGIDDGP